LFLLLNEYGPTDFGELGDFPGDLADNAGDLARDFGVNLEADPRDLWLFLDVDFEDFTDLSSSPLPLDSSWLMADIPSSLRADDCG
jgi:hypothetical protein